MVQPWPFVALPRIIWEAFEAAVRGVISDLFSVDTGTEDDRGVFQTCRASS